MKSQNSYSGINPIVVKCVRYYAKCLKRLKCFADESIEDIEQELFLLVWPTIIQYDENEGSFVAFVGQLVKCRAINLVYKQSCKKRGGKQGISYIDHTILDNIADERCRFEDEIAARIDLDEIISRLSKEWQVLCRQLEIFSVPEVAEIRGIARTTVYDILRRIRRHTKKSFLEPPTTENHSGIQNIGGEEEQYDSKNNKQRRKSKNGNRCEDSNLWSLWNRQDQSAQNPRRINNTLS